MITVVDNELQYNDALGRIDELMDARHNTKEGEELSLLTDVVVAYENKIYPEFKPKDRFQWRVKKALWRIPVRLGNALRKFAPNPTRS